MGKKEVEELKKEIIRKLDKLPPYQVDKPVDKG